MNISSICILMLALGFVHRLAGAGIEAFPAIEIPYQKFVLKNGLTLLVHEDHKTPIVAVNIWYHVGSKDEKPGKTGFAHLFEHLMFTGSENFKGSGDLRSHGSNRIEWAICLGPSIKRGSIPNAAWCKTRNDSRKSLRKGVGMGHQRQHAAQPPIPG